MSTRPAGRRWLFAAVDLIMLVALISLAAVAVAPAYGGTRWLVAAVGGAAVGGVIAALAGLLRLHWAIGLVAVVAGYFVFGTALALPAADSLLPSLDSARQLATGVITSWQQMLTVALPVGTAGALLVPVYLVAVVTGAIALTVAVRTDRPTLALVAPGLMLAMAALLGTADGPRSVLGSSPANGAILLALGLVVIGLLWASWRTRTLAGTDGGGLDLRRPVSAVLVLAAAGAAGWFVAPSVAPEEPRTALRELVETPFDPRNYPSPLAAFRKYVKNETVRQAELFTIEGLPKNARITLATLDDYNGLEFAASTVTGTFTRVGDRIPDETPGTPANLTLTMTGYSGIWMPTVGRLTGITFGGPRASDLTEAYRYAAGSGTGVVTTGVSAGDSYLLDVIVPTVPGVSELADAQPGTITLPTPIGVPDKLKSVAGTYAQGQETSAMKAEALRGNLAEKGLLSHGDTTAQQQLSPSGHGAYRLKKLLDDPKMIGDEEQFAPTMTLMARTIGLPARVVMGFRAPEDYTGTGVLSITGGDLTAWSEIYFEGVGWVPFDPTPDEEEIAQAPENQQAASVKPQNLQPPPPPQEAAEIKASDVDDSEADEELKEEDEESDTGTGDSAGVAWGLIALAVGLPLLLIGGPILLILLLKARRSRRRRTAPAMTDRIAGAWAEMLDSAADLGHRPPTASTRSEIAADLESEFAEGTSGGTLTLARQVDARIFGPEPVEETEADQFWSVVAELTGSMATTRPLLRRWRARVSLASFKRKD